MKDSKKMTQGQKSYLVTRINGIMEEKIKGIVEEYGYSVLPHQPPPGWPKDHVVDGEIIKAVIKGKVGLLPKKKVIENLKKKVTTPGHLILNNADFLDMEAVKLFNISRRTENLVKYNKVAKRVKALKDAALALKDKIMFDGEAAPKLLADFEAQEF